MPYVTMLTPSSRPGAGVVEVALQQKRLADSTSSRLEFDGVKGRSQLIKWLAARAYDNGIYVVFANPIGMDDDQLRNGYSMIIDPFGAVLAECRRRGDEVISATCTPKKSAQADGYRYRRARRPQQYKVSLGQDHKPPQKVAWRGK